MKYLAPYQIPSLSGKSHDYFEAIMIQLDSMNISQTRESPNDPNNTIIYSKCIIKKVIKPGSWRFDLTNAKAIKINDIVHQYNYWDY